MNKTELIEAIAKSTKLTKVDVAAVINAFAAQVSKSVKKGDKVTLPGFITFEKVKRDARTGRNPRTGENLKIAAKNIVKAKVGKTLQDSVN